MRADAVDAEVLATAFDAALGDEAVEIIFIPLLAAVVALDCARHAWIIALQLLYCVGVELVG